MKRGEVPAWLVFLILALAAGIGFAFIVLPKIVNLAEVPDQGCPKDTPITSVCPCGDTRISSGYCCEDGPSLVPCYCAKINKCSDYSETQCKEDECQLGCAKTYAGGRCT